MGIASRYAKSLIDLSVETKQLEEVREDMRLIKKVCLENREFVIMLESPVVKTDRKMAIFKTVFGGKITATTQTFLDLVARKRREGYIDDIAYSFDEQYKIFKNITTAVITTAVKLDDSSKAKALELIAKEYKGEIELIEKTDKDLIGGFVLTVNGKQVDTSIKRKLNDFKKNFSGNLYVPDLN